MAGTFLGFCLRIDVNQLFEGFNPAVDDFIINVCFIGRVVKLILSKIRQRIFSGF